MTIKQINARSDMSNFSQTTDLDGEDYVLFFRWNQRDGRWFFSMKKNDMPVITSCRVVADVPLFRAGKSSPFPPGIIMVIDENGAGRDPGLGDLGETHSVVYFSAETSE